MPLTVPRVVMSLVRINCEAYQLTPEGRQLAGQIWPNLLINLDEKWVSCEEKLIDIEDICSELADVKGITIKPIAKVRFVSPAPFFSTNKLPEVKEFVRNVSQIVMPGFELLKYGEIQVLENSCTVEIQNQLDKNWRIIAVLPQPQQRRPDYVMVREVRRD